MVFEAPLARVEGRAAFRAVNEGTLKRAAHVHIEDIAAVGDDARVMVTWTMIFRTKSGRERRILAASELRIEGGRVVYRRDRWDVLAAVISGFPALEPTYRKVMARFW